MRDWRELVRRRLGPLGLYAGREEEIIRELADHLEESWHGRRGSGPATEEDQSRALDTVDWVVARREIRRAELEEGLMHYRNRSLWLPGLITSTLFWGLLGILDTHGVHGRILWPVHPPLIISLPWTLALPVIGALGALISRRLGGRPRESLLAGLFPSAYMCAVCILFSPIALLRVVPASKIHLLYGFLSVMLGSVIIPGAALFVGALPVAMARRHAPASSNVRA